MSETNVESGPAATEEQARKLGWKPLDEWNGKDDNWVDAEEFVQRGDGRILRERLAEADKRLAKAEATIADQSKTINDFKDWRSKTEENATKRALAELQEKQRQAMKDEDEDAFEAASKEVAELTDEATKAKEETSAETVDDDPHFKVWHEKNLWYNDDIRMTRYANEIAPIAGKKHPGGGPAFYDAIAEAVKEEFPDRFENPRRNNAATVEGGGGTKTRKKTKGYDDLDREAKDACDRFVKQDLMTKEEYLAVYEWDE